MIKLRCMCSTEFMYELLHWHTHLKTVCNMFTLECLGTAYSTGEATEWKGIVVGCKNPEIAFCYVTEDVYLRIFVTGSLKIHLILLFVMKRSPLINWYNARITCSTSRDLSHLWVEFLVDRLKLKLMWRWSHLAFLSQKLQCWVVHVSSDGTGSLFLVFMLPTHSVVLCVGTLMMISCRVCFHFVDNNIMLSHNIGSPVWSWWGPL